MSRVCAIVLAAGMSRRLGQPKQLLDLNGKAVIAHVVDRVLSAGIDDVLVVTGHERQLVESTLADRPVHLVFNVDYAEGQGTSLAAGVRALGPGVDAAVIVLGDQPLIDPRVIRDVIDRWQVDGPDVVQAAYLDGRGHPVLFSRACFGELAALRGDVGGKGVISAHRAKAQRVIVNRKNPRDIDTPDDWAEIRNEASTGY